MKLTASIPAAALLLAAASAASAGETGAGNRELDRALEGRVAGAPVQCILYERNGSTTIIPGVGLLFRGAGSRVYLNRPANGASSLDRWKVPVTEVRGSSICAREVVQLIDPSTHMLSGLVSLGEFVPYTKAK